ncbi:MAG: SBBP repeat-containing protein, partial [Candidatus Hermodarchaeota archaeon]
MRKIPFILLILTAFSISFCFVNLSVTTDMLIITEIEEKFSSSSSLFYLSGEEDTIENFQTSVITKPVQFPFTGFIQNLGQLKDDDIQYYYSANDLSIGFSSSKITFVSSLQEDSTPVHFSLSFLGSQRAVPVGHSKMTPSINYFYANMRFTNVPLYEEVWYHNLYPGIDLCYYMSNQGLKYDFIVHPGANPNEITIEISKSMKLTVEDQTVTLQSRFQSKKGYFQDTALQVRQIDGKSVPARFITRGTNLNSYGFQLEAFNPSQTLIIDPLWLSFSTYLGGSNQDHGWGITVDIHGNTYVTGHTCSINFPTKNAY